MPANLSLSQPRLITVEEFEKIVHSKIFPDRERIELIEGHLVSRPPAGAAEAACIQRLDHLLGDATASRVLTSVHDPVRLPHSQLQPDLAWLKPRADNYFGGGPTAPDVLLIVEVADISADYDRNVKISLYGRNGIAEAWLIDLSAGVIETYRQPNQSGYSEERTYKLGDRLAPAALPDIVLTVAGILGTRA